MATRSLPFEQTLLEALSKSVCLAGDGAVNGNDLNRQWPVIQQLFSQLFAAPFAYIEGDASNIISSAETTIRDDQRVAAPALFAQVVRLAVVPAADNGWLGVIIAKCVMDKAGRNAEVKAKNFVLRARSGESYSLSPGDVFQYHFDVRGNRVAILSPDSGGSGGDGTSTIVFNDGSTDITINSTSHTAWAKCQHQWERNSGTYRVSVKLLTNYGGSETGNAFYVYLRGGGPDQDPIAYKGQKIEIKIDGDGTYISTDPSAWDKKIGSVKQFMFDPAPTYITDSGKIISGWGRQNGTDNGSTNGGTALNVQDHFLWAKSETGEDVDADDLIDAQTHIHSGGETGCSTTGITVATAVEDHPPHVHYMGHICNTACTSGTAANYWTSFADEHNSGGQKDLWTGPPQTYYSSAHSASDHVDLTLCHVAESDVTDPGHSHTGADTGPAQSDCAKVRMFFLERLDNSRERLSI
jgi:hypothetical protein